jgi:drug/metabolite transporter (DMT)-like permease
MVASVLTFPLFFRLQAVGGPVLLSQIGTVAAAVGVAVGAGLLGERYPPGVWTGVLLIALGIGLTVRAQRVR